MDRQVSLERIKTREKPWDIVVIGGGATGVGCALDAATRGLDVLLLEQNDFGKGTSSRSTKLIHGGVRYLKQGNLALVREALRERGRLLRNAPPVVQKLPFVIPCYSTWQKLYYGFGLKIYDVLAGKYRLGRSRILSRRETIDHLPGIKKEGLHGGVLYFDAQFDDTRLLIDMAVTANQNGACLLNYAKATAINKDTNGRIAGVDFVDAENSGNVSVLAKVIINAAGPFCDEVRALADPNAERILELSQGTHLVFKQNDGAAETAMLIPKTSDGRVLLAIPWQDHLLVGTTDTPIAMATLEPKPLDAEIEFILETLGEQMETPPSRDDILSAFTGIRPLVRSNGKQNTAELSRSHTIKIGPSGLVTITGGKWTTYRQMAEDTVDSAVSSAGLPATECRTRELKILTERQRAIADLISEDPELAGRLHPDFPYTRADIVLAVRNEMALTVEDVLARRTRALFLDARTAVQVAPAVAEIMAAERGENSEWIAEQLSAFTAVAENYLPG